MLCARGTGTDSESAFCLIFLFCQTPQDSQRVATFAGANESAPFQRLDGISIRGQRTYFLIVFQPPQNGVAAEGVSFKLVSVLHVRKQVLFCLCEFRQEISSFLLRHFSRPCGSLFW